MSSGPRDADDAIPDPTNRRITGMILAFVAVSLAASALPLLPDVRAWLPVEILARDRGMTAYGLALAAFMALIFPLFPRPGGRAGLIGWWWMGGFLLAFAGAPLFLLAYIAGVHRDGVLEVLIQVGILHGAALLLLRVFGPGRRSIIVACGFLVVVVLPVIDGMSGLMVGRSPRFDWLPASRILALTRDFAEPALLAPATILAALYVLVIVSGRWRRRGVPTIAAACGLLLLAFGGAAPAVGLETSRAAGKAPAPAAAAGARAAPTVEAEARLFAPAGIWRVAGRTTALRVDLGDRDEVVVQVGDREAWRLRSADLPARRAWIHPRLLAPGETLRLRTRDGITIAEIGLRMLPASERLVLVLGERGEAEIDAMLARAPAALRLELVSPADVPDEPLGFDAFSLFATTRARFERLDEGVRRALEDWVLRGGTLYLLGDRVGDRAFGEGRVLERTEPLLPEAATLKDREQPVYAQNLYSAFALPDWSEVDLDRVLVFLCVYHLLFIAIFLLPLCLDSKKSMSVYLASVGFVLSLVTGASYFALKAIFFTETQLLLQSLDLIVYEEIDDAEPRLARRELVCFASFNGEPGRLVFARDHAPQLVPERAWQGVGPVRVLEDEIVLEEVPLDRFRRKQVIELATTSPSPFRFRRDARGGVLETATGAEHGPFGRSAVRRRSAFARLDGRLHAARLGDDGRLEIAARPALLGFSEVARDAPAETLPFLRWALGRIGPPAGDLAVLITEGWEPLHPGEGHLHERRLLQVLAIPLD